MISAETGSPLRVFVAEQAVDQAPVVRIQTAYSDRFSQRQTLPAI